MSATWSIANGRFDTLVACSSVRGSSSPAHDLIGTCPGLVTMGRAVAVALAAVVDVSEVSMVDMIAGPPASIVVGGVAERVRTAIAGLTTRSSAIELRPPQGQWTKRNRLLGWRSRWEGGRTQPCATPVDASDRSPADDRGLPRTRRPSRTPGRRFGRSSRIAVGVWSSLASFCHRSNRCRRSASARAVKVTRPTCQPTLQPPKGTFEGGLTGGRIVSLLSSVHAGDGQARVFGRCEGVGYFRR